MTRWWMSWIVAEDDHRPLTFPPNQAVLGWWCTGYDADDNSILCGLVEASSLKTAESAVLVDWPGIRWRFKEEREPNFVVTSDRFPLSDWMRQRMKHRVA